MCWFAVEVGRVRGDGGLEEVKPILGVDRLEETLDWLRYSSLGGETLRGLKNSSVVAWAALAAVSCCLERISWARGLDSQEI